MRVRVFAVCLLLTAFVPAAFAEQNPVKPGKWQWSMQMEIPGMPFKMPPIKVTHCVTEEDVKTAIPQDQKSKDCTVAEYEIDGSTIRWKMDCPKQKMTGNGEMTYEEDSMSGKMVMVTDGQEMTTKYSGKRLGNCDK